MTDEKNIKITLIDKSNFPIVFNGFIEPQSFECVYTTIPIDESSEWIVNQFDDDDDGFWSTEWEHIYKKYRKIVLEPFKIIEV